MKTVLLNDTRSAEHVGCTLVMEQTLAHCRRVGIEVVACLTTAACKEPLIGTLETLAFENVLINGEGSMHHDRPVPTHLCEAANWARNQGKKAVLFNSLWQANDALNQHLGAFDRIYCRDSLSAEAVANGGGSCRVVPDMIFASVFDAFGGEDAVSSSEESHEIEHDGDRETENDWVVIDSIDRKKSEALSRFANRHGFPFLHMDRIGYERLRKRLFVRTGWFGSDPGFVTRFVETLRGGRGIVSGRFHGTCLAMVLGLPVISIVSNTSKLEALHRDAGLDERLVLSRVPRGTGGLEEIRALAERSVPLATTYVERARQEIEAMFDEIAKLFGD